MSALLMIRDLMELKVLPGVAVSAGEALTAPGVEPLAEAAVPPVSSVLSAHLSCSAN